MKLFFTILFLFATNAQAANWVSVTPNHGNYLYSQGEQAEFRFQLNIAPTNPAYRIKTTLEYVGHSAPAEVIFTGGIGGYLSPALQTGQENFRVISSLVSVPEGTYSQVLEDRVFILNVVSN